MHKEITIFNETILPGKSKTINMQIGKLHTMTDLHIPIIVERSKKKRASGVVNRWFTWG